MSAEETQATPESGTNKQQSDRLSVETIARTLSLLAVLFYALGLIVQNVYLASFGISDFDLLRAKTILTGILCAALLAVGAIPTLLVFAVTFVPGTDAVWRKRLISGWILVACMSIVAFFALRHPDLSVESVELHEIAWVVTTRFAAGAMTFISILSSIVFLGMAKRDTTLGERFHDLRSAVAVNCFFLMLGLPDIYAALPAQFGGGKPVPVVLILTEDGRKVWHRLTSQYHDSDDPFVQLVYEREKNLLVRANTHYDIKTLNTVIVLDKALVHAVVPQPGKYNPTK